MKKERDIDSIFKDALDHRRDAVPPEIWTSVDDYLTKRHNHQLRVKYNRLKSIVCLSVVLIMLGTWYVIKHSASVYEHVALKQIPVVVGRTPSQQNKTSLVPGSNKRDSVTTAIIYVDTSLREAGLTVSDSLEKVPEKRSNSLPPGNLQKNSLLASGGLVKANDIIQGKIELKKSIISHLKKGRMGVSSMRGNKPSENTHERDKNISGNANINQVATGFHKNGNRKQSNLRLRADKISEADEVVLYLLCPMQYSQ